MADSMIERVKTAIAETFAPAIDFKAPYAKVMLDMAARAALSAMREPTEAMERAAYSIIDRHEEGARTWEIDVAWRNAIDAALNEHPASDAAGPTRTTDQDA